MRERASRASGEKKKAFLFFSLFHICLPSKPSEKGNKGAPICHRVYCFLDAPLFFLFPSLIFSFFFFSVCCLFLFFFCRNRRKLPYTVMTKLCVVDPLFDLSSSFLFFFLIPSRLLLNQLGNICAAGAKLPFPLARLLSFFSVFAL